MKQGQSCPVFSVCVFGSRWYNVVEGLNRLRERVGRLSALKLLMSVWNACVCVVLFTECEGVFHGALFVSPLVTLLCPLPWRPQGGASDWISAVVCLSFALSLLLSLFLTHTLLWRAFDSFDQFIVMCLYRM